MQTNYADTILNIGVTGALVRIDLATVTPVNGEDGKQELRAVQTQQLVMPLDGFLKAFELQDGLIKKMLSEGMLKQQGSEESK